MIVSFELSLFVYNHHELLSFTVMALPLAADFPELAHLSSVSIESFFAGRSILY
jgi:hypothetical protein